MIADRVDFKPILLLLIVITLTFFTGRLVAQSSPQVPLIIILGIGVCILTFIKPDLGLVVLIFSMLLSPELELAQVPKRTVVVRLDDILLIVVFFTWLAKLAINKELGLLKKTPLNLPIGLYLFACYLFTGVGIVIGNVHPIKSFFYLLKYTEYFILYFLFVNNLDSKEKVYRFFTASIITAIIVCIYAYSQFGTRYRATAPFEGLSGEPASFGGYLLIILFVIFSLFLYTRSLKQKFLWAGLSFFMFVPFLQTLSRASYVGFIPAFLTLLVFTKKGKLFLIILAVSVITLPNFLIPKNVAKRVQSTFIGKERYQSGVYESRLDSSSRSRVKNWKEIFSKWLRRPIFGYGITGLGFIDSQYVRTLGELGLVGFSIFIWLMVSIFRQIYRTFKIVENDFTKGLSLGLLAGFVGLLFQALTTNTFIIIRIMEPFWFFTAMVICLPTIFPRNINQP